VGGYIYGVIRKSPTMEEQQVGGWMYLWQARKSPMMEEPIRNAACDLADHV
jgi:hypothetical protein